MFIAALFTIAKMWKPHKCPSTDEWIKKMWHTHAHTHTDTHAHTHMNITQPWMKFCHSQQHGWTAGYYP